MEANQKYACPCCGFYTLDEEPKGTFDICPVCYWEDDNIQSDDPAYEGGANGVSLIKARENFKKFGAISEQYIQYVRNPAEEETASEELPKIHHKGVEKISEIAAVGG